MSPAGFKPAIPAIQRPQTYALDHAATVIDRPTESLLRFSAQMLYMCSWIQLHSVAQNVEPVPLHFSITAVEELVAIFLSTCEYVWRPLKYS
jgi:hypothetical protein